VPSHPKATAARHYSITFLHETSIAVQQRGHLCRLCACPPESHLSILNVRRSLPCVHGMPVLLILSAPCALIRFLPLCLVCICSHPYGPCPCPHHRTLLEGPMQDPDSWMCLRMIGRAALSLLYLLYVVSKQHAVMCNCVHQTQTDGRQRVQVVSSRRCCCSAAVQLG